MDRAAATALELDEDVEGGDEEAEERAAEAIAESAATEPVPGALPESALARPASGQADAETASDVTMGPLAPPGKKGKGHAKKKDKKKRTGARKPVAAAAPAATGPWTAGELATLVGREKATNVIVQIAARDTMNGVALLQAANAWAPLIAALPEGAQTSHALRKAMLSIVLLDAVSVDEMKTMFAKRFKHVMEESGAVWTADYIKAVWRELDALPEADVSKNTFLTVFRAISGDMAYGPAWDDASINAIEIGDAHDLGTMPHTVRHEVGHAVHADIQGVVNPWLENDMKFWFVDLDDWIRELGGYPKKYHYNGADHAINAIHEGELLQLVDEFMGKGGWDPAKPTPDDGIADPELQAKWDATSPALKNACAQSKSYWYQNWSGFQQKNGCSYFLNHYYHRPFKFGATAGQAIAATGDDYTAMSEKEFFANCYAEYFGDPAGYNDHAKWGGALPSSVKDFFKTCILQRQPYRKFKKQQKKKGNP